MEKDDRKATRIGKPRRIIGDILIALAAVMRDYLVERGVPEEKLRLEDQAETTKENFRDTARMIDPNAPVVLITSDYHMDRAVRTAKAAGFTDVMRLPAPSSALLFGANVLWEVILELNELTLKQ